MTVLRPSPGRHSLRWRLLAAVCVSVLLIWLATAWLSYTLVQREAEELMDGSLAQTGHLLLSIVQDNEGEIAALAERLAQVRGSPENVYEPPLEFQIGLGDGTVLARSRNAPALPILGVRGYGDIQRGEESWRVLNVAAEDGRYRVQVSQSIGLRDRAALEVATQTVLPLALITPLLVLFIYVSIRRGLRPLEQLAAAVAARTPGNLAQLSDAGVPTEARPLVGSLNRLFGRVGQALDNERRFTADAAHELRTPLAALRVQAQVALLSGNQAAREKALRQILHGVDRAGRLLEQLLRLARLDPQQGLALAAPVAVAPLLREVLAQALADREEPGREVTLDPVPGDLAVKGDAELLVIGLRNLLDNALRYTRVGDRIRLRALATGATVALRVEDSGPGVPEAELARLAQRFVRGRDQLEEGSGLGLAIVQRIAELHEARLALANLPGGGFAAGIEGLESAFMPAASA